MLEQAWELCYDLTVTTDQLNSSIVVPIRDVSYGLSSLEPSVDV